MFQLHSMKIEIGSKLLFSTISKVYLVQDIDKVFMIKMDEQEKLTKKK